MLSSASRSMRWAFLLMDMTDSRTSMEPWTFPLVICSGGWVGDKGMARGSLEHRVTFSLSSLQTQRSSTSSHIVKRFVRDLICKEHCAMANFILV